MTYRAVWFCKLRILEDDYEGRIPAPTKAKLHTENQAWKLQFNSPEFHRQIDDWPNDIEDSGRELLVVSCWFLGETESTQMWQEYGLSDESVAVTSTIKRLATSLLVPTDPTYTHFGKVEYVDHKNFNMGLYEAHQAIELAFIKDREKFAHEQEVRLVTMNFKTTGCVSPKGEPYKPDQVSGAKMNNFENPGLYVQANLPNLITKVVICPKAQPWFVALVQRIMQLSGLNVPVEKSLATDA